VKAAFSFSLIQNLSLALFLPRSLSLTHAPKLSFSLSLSLSLSLSFPLSLSLTHTHTQTLFLSLSLSLSLSFPLSHTHTPSLSILSLYNLQQERELIISMEVPLIWPIYSFLLFFPAKVFFRSSSFYFSLSSTLFFSIDFISTFPIASFNSYFSSSSAAAAAAVAAVYLAREKVRFLLPVHARMAKKRNVKSKVAKIYLGNWSRQGHLNVKPIITFAFRSNSHLNAHSDTLLPVCLSACLLFCLPGNPFHPLSTVWPLYHLFPFLSPLSLPCSFRAINPTQPSQVFICISLNKKRITRTPTDDEREKERERERERERKRERERERERKRERKREREREREREKERERERERERKRGTKERLLPAALTGKVERDS
jgi:hypothetical protein